MYYLIKSILEECSAEEVHKSDCQYVVVLTPEEWARE